MDLMVLAMARKYMDKKVAELVSAGWTKEIVKELPTTGNEKTIYMVEQVDNVGNIYYDEYMYTNGKFDGIGTTRVDLSNYAKKEYVDNAKAENEELIEKLEIDKADKTYVDSELDKKANLEYVDGRTAYSLKAPGLYNIDNELISTWDELIETEKITVVDNCITSSDLVIPDCKLIISNSVTSIGDDAFSGCTSLISIIIPNSVTSISSGAFASCTSLTSVTIPDSVINIADGAFSNCDSLTNITIGNGVTSIGEAAFVWCYALTSITISDSITSIGYDVFNGCSSLTDVYYKGTKSDFSKIEIASGNDNFKNAIIHYELTDEIYNDIQELTPTISSILPTTLVRNTEYYLGDISDSITLSFPNDVSHGDYIYINFNAISDITLTIDISNTSDIDIVPVSGTNYEIFATYNGSIWILGYNEYTVGELDE